MVENGKVYQQRTRGPECSAAVMALQSPGQPPRQVTLVRYQISAPVADLSAPVTMSGKVALPDPDGQRH